MKDKVFAFTKEFDFNSVNHLLAEFCFYEKMNDSRVKLQSILGEDADGITEKIHFEKWKICVMLPQKNLIFKNEEDLQEDCRKIGRFKVK